MPPRPSFALALTVAAACSLGAQTPPHGEHPPGAAARRSSSHLGAQGIGVVTHASPAFAGRSFTEGYFSQPVVMGELAPGDGRLRLTGTLNLEGMTLRRGELNGGIYGEGYVDRRHPHTLVHEAMAAFGGRVLGARASIAAGKGFVAFGTDDPMMRPFVKFPVNHHLAQILERYVVVGAMRAGPALIEATTFNGDEPSGPYAWPSVRRFGDSWAVRGTLAPFTGGRAARLAGTQLSASLARLESPENAFGGGLDQRKSSLALRHAHGAALGAAGVGDRRPGEYVLVEWARTDETAGARRAFRYQSVLAEAAVRRRGVEVAARAERTDRPEEERLLDPFRSVRPHFENTIIGVTRWRVLTLGASGQLATRGALPLRLAPFVELSHLTPRQLVRPSLFEPSLFYGARTQWGLSTGVRLGIGGSHARMGRYGVAADTHASH